MDLPPKLFFRIGEVAGLVGVEPHVLRYWEREFRSIRPSKSAKGQRVYSRKDVENLLRVRDLLYRDGFTIAGARKKLQRAVGGNAVAIADAGDVRTANAAPTLDVIAQSPVVTGAAETGPRETSPLETSPRAEPRDGVREKLTALRTEVEAFLTELSASR